jgi:O-antigen ligase
MLVSAPVSISATQAGLGLATAGAAWDCVRRRRLPRTSLDGPVLALLGVTLLSALASEAPGPSLRRFAGSWVALALYLAAGWLGAPERLARFLRLALPTAALFAAYGILQHFTGWNLLGAGALHSIELGGGTTYLPRGGFSHYQTYANVFFILFCLAVSLAAGAGGRARALLGATALLLGAAVVFSFTRGIWVSLLAALAIFAAVFARRALLVAAAAVGAAILVAVAVPSSFRSRALSMVDTSTNVERLLLWETTWNMLRDRPLLGVGVGNYRRVQERYVRAEVPLAMTRTHAHNIWLQAAVERGLLGVVALAWLGGAALTEAAVALRRIAPGRGLPRALAAGALAALCGFFLDGLVQNNFGDSQVALLFWLVAGVAVVAGRAAGSRAAGLPAGAPCR